MIETLGVLCVLWTMVELSRLALRAQQGIPERYDSVRAWDSHGNAVVVEMVEVYAKTHQV